MKESGEMYLEAVYVLSRTKSAVRSIDVAEHMNYSKPSVSRGMGLLKKRGFIVVNPDGHIILTESGKKAAKKIYDRHRVLTKMLMALGVDEQTAANDACKMEHILSDKTFNAMKRHLKNTDTN